MITKQIFCLFELNFFLDYVVTSTGSAKNHDRYNINAQSGYNSQVGSEILQKLRAIE